MVFDIRRLKKEKDKEGGNKKSPINSYKSNI
jgi:hypothetical protein